MSAAMYVRVSDVLRLIPPRRPNKMAREDRIWSSRDMRRLSPKWANELKRGDRVFMRPACRRRLGLELRAGTVIQAARHSDGVHLRVLVDGESKKEMRWWHASWFLPIATVQRIPAAAAYRTAA